MNAPMPERNDMAARLEALESELRALQARDRRLKRLLAACLVAAGVFAALGQTRTGRADDADKPKTIEADTFLVKGPNGKPIASLNKMGLVLNDEAGNARAALFNNNDNGSRGLLLFSANDQKQQLFAMRTKEGLIAFGINDPNGKTRAWLGTDSTGEPSFKLQTGEGQPIFTRP
jgi:hypothetical protein